MKKNSLLLIVFISCIFINMSSVSAISMVDLYSDLSTGETYDILSENGYSPSFNLSGTDKIIISYQLGGDTIYINLTLEDDYLVYENETDLDSDTFETENMLIDLLINEAVVYILDDQDYTEEEISVVLDYIEMSSGTFFIKELNSLEFIKTSNSGVYYFEEFTINLTETNAYYPTGTFSTGDDANYIQVDIETDSEDSNCSIYKYDPNDLDSKFDLVAELEFDYEYSYKDYEIESNSEYSYTVRCVVGELEDFTLTSGKVVVDTGSEDTDTTVDDSNSDNPQTGIVTPIIAISTLCVIAISIKFYIKNKNKITNI